MKSMHQLFLIITTLSWASCTIDGVSWMDKLKQKELENNKKNPSGKDECNPLYWYPKPIPDYCQSKDGTVSPVPVPEPPYPEQKPPLPVPMPSPYQPMPAPPPMPRPMQPLLVPPPMPLPGPLLPVPAPVQMPPLPYGIPIQPSGPMLPVLANSYPFPPQPYPMPQMSPMSPMYPMYRPRYQFGFVPGLEGMVSPGGGINILPFSDVYADLLERHKQKMMRKEMEKILEKYSNKYKKHRKGTRHNMY